MRGGPFSVRRRAAAVLVTVAALPVLLVGCGGDDGDGAGERDDGRSASETTAAADVVASRALATAGADAAAAQGSGLEEAPGPDDRDRDRFERFGEVAIAIRAPDGSVMGWCVLLADQEEQRQQGLMEVTDLGGYPGMLFVWNQDSSSSFYMRNTPTPLSIAWFDAEGALVSTADMEPCADVDDCPLYGPESSRPYRFALEVPQGELASLGIEEGSVLRVGGDCVARSP
jgi:uncharacterized membrane protein (UPF0127 family)